MVTDRWYWEWVRAPRNRLWCSLLVCLAGIVAAGCGKSAQSATAQGDKAFRAAPPEIKVAWETAAAASKTNNYAVAMITSNKLLSQPGLTTEQTQAVQEFCRVVGDRMYDAANKGDPNAKEAFDALRKLQAH